MSSTDQAAEPSMDEILASIRRIIADEPTPEPSSDDAGGDDDILDLSDALIASDPPASAPPLADEPAGFEQAAQPMPEPLLEPAVQQGGPVMDAPQEMAAAPMGVEAFQDPTQEMPAAFPEPNPVMDQGPVLDQRIAGQGEFQQQMQDPGMAPGGMMGAPEGPGFAGGEMAPQGYAPLGQDPNAVQPFQADATQAMPGGAEQIPLGLQRNLEEIPSGPAATFAPGAGDVAMGQGAAPFGGQVSPMQDQAEPLDLGQMMPAPGMEAAPGDNFSTDITFDGMPAGLVSQPIAMPGDDLAASVENSVADELAQVLAEGGAVSAPAMAVSEVLPLVAAPVAASPAPIAAGAVGGPKTLEQSIQELLKPMLREWLDENMPRIVEDVVKSEIDPKG